MFKKLNWGHGVAIALAAFICFIMFMIIIFPLGQQNSELVSNNYYEEELSYQEVIDAKRNAEKLPEKPVYQQLKDGIKITFPQSIKPDGKKIDFILYRTDDANLDVKKEALLDAANSILIPENVISKGSYTLKLKWQQNEKQYQLDYDILWN
jgi:hypothetical protein